MMEQRILRPAAPSNCCRRPLVGWSHPAEPGSGAVAVAGRARAGAPASPQQDRAARPLWPDTATLPAAGGGSWRTGHGAASPSQIRRIAELAKVWEYKSVPTNSQFAAQQLRCLWKFLRELPGDSGLLDYSSMKGKRGLQKNASYFTIDWH